VRRSNLICQDISKHLLLVLGQGLSHFHHLAELIICKFDLNTARVWEIFVIRPPPLMLFLGWLRDVLFAGFLRCGGETSPTLWWEAALAALHWAALAIDTHTAQAGTRMT
jgi:hypothetical protein